MKRMAALAAYWLILAAYAWAALDLSDIGVGARPLGMGKAYVGLADDASAIFMNPAGLAQNRQLNIISMSGTLLSDVNYVMLGAADNSPLGKFGIGYVNASIGSIPLTRLTGSGPSLEAVQYATTDYSSNVILFSYGSKLSRFLRGGAGGNFSLGANLKIFSQGFSGGGAPMQDASGAGLDADLGFILDVSRYLSLGLTFQNFLPESFGGKFIWKERGGNPQVIEAIPMATRAGGVLHVISSQKFDVLFDYETVNRSKRPGVFHAGVEYWPQEEIALRFGLDQKPKASEAGIGVDNNLTAGVGLLLGGFTFDYSYHQFGELSENSTHFFSLGYRGTEKTRERQRIKAEKKKSSIPQPEIVSKPALKTFYDVPEDYWARKPIEYLATLGIMDGYEDGEFKPTKEITRGELAVILVKAKGFSAGKEIKIHFNDVSLQSFEAPYISIATERKYIQGFPDGAFHPEKRITRAEAAQVMARVSGIYLKSKIKHRVFDDLPADHWASPAVAAAKETGLFEYLAGQGFGPNFYLTRAEAAEIISKTPFVKLLIEKLISGEK